MWMSSSELDLGTRTIALCCFAFVETFLEHKRGMIPIALMGSSGSGRRWLSLGHTAREGRKRGGKSRVCDGLQVFRRWGMA